MIGTSPDDEKDAFDDWLEYVYSYGTGPYQGKEFDDYRTGCTPSSHVFVGTVKKT